MNWLIGIGIAVVFCLCCFVYAITQDAQEDPEDLRANEDDDIADEVPGDNFPGGRK